jgi:hypothetical protein
MASKHELLEYLNYLYDCLEREQTVEPKTVGEITKAIRSLKERCVSCDINVMSLTTFTKGE